MTEKKVDATLFTPERRVQLWFLVSDLIEAPRREFDGDYGGEQMLVLHEALQRSLGRLHIGKGDGVAEQILSFIRYAQEDDLLTLVSLLPIAQVGGYDRATRISPFATRPDILALVRSVNQFMEHIGHPARFENNGSFQRNPILKQIPQEISGLPKKEDLLLDLKRLARIPKSATIVFVDLDNFKKVNDTKGHVEGDNCLAVVVRQISAVIEGRGNLYRYGGDEFVVVLPNFTISEGAATAERIRKQIETSRPGGEIDVTASIGVVEFDPSENSDLDMFLHSADQAMYQSKQAGKNRVTVHEKG